MHDLTVIVLAAGGGTRMKSKTVKVLHRLGGRTMLDHVLHAVYQAEPARVVTVVGTQGEQVAAHLATTFPDCTLAHQPVQQPDGPKVPYGTGYAVQVAVSALAEAGAELGRGTVLVVTGDTPLLQGASLREFAAAHTASRHAVSVLSAEVPDPFGYGRIVRGPDGLVQAITEEKDATDVERTINEISSGILAFDAEFLGAALPKLRDDNAKGELYLTDTVALAHGEGRTVEAHLLDDADQTEGCNDRAQLAALGRKLNDRIVREAMLAGVTVMDPATTWIDADVTLAPDCTLLPGIQLLGATTIATDAVIGPDCTLKDCEVGAAARVVRTHAELAVIGDGASVGPFSYLRPGSVIGAGGKVGAFVELKNATLGEGAKVPHLSYVGDAEIGAGTNIGAGNIVANYDGVAKHRTVVGKQVRTGANNTLVAPVEIGDGAATGAGTVVRRDIPPGALAVSGGPQRHVAGWTQRKRPGTPMAAAAAEAASAEASPGPDPRWEPSTGADRIGPTDAPE